MMSKNENSECVKTYEKLGFASKSFAKWVMAGIRVRRNVSIMWLRILPVYLFVLLFVSQINFKQMMIFPSKSSFLLLAPKSILILDDKREKSDTDFCSFMSYRLLYYALKRKIIKSLLSLFLFLGNMISILSSQNLPQIMFGVIRRQFGIVQKAIAYFKVCSYF